MPRLPHLILLVLLLLAGCASAPPQHERTLTYPLPPVDITN